MKRLERYIVSHQWLGAFALFFMMISWLAGEPGMGVFFAIVQFGVGVLQLLSAIHIATSKKTYPDWLQKRMTTYWWLTVAYFIALHFILRFFGTDDFALRFWLFGTPWMIAIYQYSLFYRLRDERIYQEESRGRSTDCLTELVQER